MSSHVPGPLDIRASRVVVSAHRSLGETTIRIQGDRIVALTVDLVKSREPDACFELHDGVLLPGLVNAHTHLDLSLLGDPSDHDVTAVHRDPSGRDFVTWLRRLVARRAGLTVGQQRQAVVAGIEASIRAGTTTLGDIDSFGVSGPILSASGLRGVSYREVLGLEPGVIDRARELLAGWEAQPWSDLSHLARGFSPHAPYSSSPALYELADHLARHRGVPIATHAAETSEERAWLEEGRGALGVLLRELFAGRCDVESPARGPIEILSRSGFLGTGRALVHANDARDAEIALIARSGSSVVFCPRSHAFFGYPPHPLRTMRARSIQVGLGSDSMASGGTLSMIDEMVMIRRSRPDLGLREAFEMATSGGHAALGSDHPGRLVSGAPADCIGLCGPSPIPRNHDGLLDWIVSGEARVVFSLVGGRVLGLAGEPTVTRAGKAEEFYKKPGSEQDARLWPGGSGRLDFPLPLG